MRETLITARLQHPSIVPIYQAGRWPNGEQFYAMKLVSGRSLVDIIESSPSLDARLALLPHVLAVAEAMAYAHSRRIIHRDLKPANILVGDFGETVVIDWGLAKLLNAEKTRALEHAKTSSKAEIWAQICPKRASQRSATGVMAAAPQIARSESLFRNGDPSLFGLYKSREQAASLRRR